MHIAMLTEPLHKLVKGVTFLNCSREMSEPSGSIRDYIRLCAVSSTRQRECIGIFKTYLGRSKLRSAQTELKVSLETHLELLLI
jgi:hypothetical protein